MPNAGTIYHALGRNPVHPFPARMAPEIVSRIIRSAKRPMRVLDPMSGSGTVIALAQQASHAAFGIDVDPLAVLIARVWTRRINHHKVKLRATSVLKRAREVSSRMDLRDAFPSAASSQTRAFIRYWFDAQSRRQLKALSDGIGRTRDATTRDALWCAFSRLIIAKQAGASRALDLAHSRPHRFYRSAPALPFDYFVDEVEHVLRNALDSKAARKQASVRLGDARKLPIASDSIDLVLTSPPYLNAIDYIRCSKFTLVWMGFSIEKLTNIRRSSVGTEAVDSDSLEDAELNKLAQLLTLSGLSKRHLGIVLTYMYDMRTCIAEVARVLAVGGKAVYVVGENTIRGQYIETAKIIKSLARRRGLRLTSSRRRILPHNRRYLPPPKRAKSALDGRMRAEIILHFVRER